VIRFTGPLDTDKDGQYFDASTDFGTLGARDIYWWHGWSKGLSVKAIGSFVPEITEEGLIASPGTLDLSGPYADTIYAKASKGELGWSSDSARHLTRIDAKTGYIQQWPIVGASLAPLSIVRDSKAVVGVKAFQDRLIASVKAGRATIGAMQGAKLNVLRDAFRSTAARIDALLPFVDVLDPGINDVVEADTYDLRWKLEDIESSITSMNAFASAVKAGAELSSMNRKSLEACLEAMGEAYDVIEALLARTSKTEAAATKAAAVDPTDWALAMAALELSI